MRPGRDELLRPDAGLDAEEPPVEGDQAVVDVVRVHEADGVVQVRVDEDADEEGQDLAQALDRGSRGPEPQAPAASTREDAGGDRERAGRPPGWRAPRTPGLVRVDVGRRP